MSWGVFPEGRTGLSSLRDPLLESSLDPLESSLLDPLLESSTLCQCESELHSNDSQSVSQSDRPSWL